MSRLTVRFRSRPAEVVSVHVTSAGTTPSPAQVEESAERYRSARLAGTSRSDAALHAVSPLREERPDLDLDPLVDQLVHEVERDLPWEVRAEALQEETLERIRQVTRESRERAVAPLDAP